LQDHLTPDRGIETLGLEQGSGAGVEQEFCVEENLPGAPADTSLLVDIGDDKQQDREREVFAGPFARIQEQRNTPLLARECDG
jgi:hypothetical protein